MATNEEHFLPRWGPAVFLDARALEPGDAHGVGRVVEVRTKAFLPLTLTWRFRVTGAMRPTQIAVETSGDLAGIGAWFFDPAGRRGAGAPGGLRPERRPRPAGSRGVS